MSGGLTGDSFSFNFRAPTGVTFKPGSYPRAEGYPFEAAGRPGIDVGGDGRGCNEQSGHFDVRDFAVNSSGTITRLWLLYEQHCEGGLPSLFGEVRIGIPAGAAVAAPDTIRWPDTYPNSAGQAVPVWVRPRASTPVTLTGVALAGPNARDFLIRGDECTGLTVHQGDYCVVYVRFAPKGSGPRTGQLSMRTAAGQNLRVTLDGLGIAGTTQWDMTSDQGDYIGQGETYTYTAGRDAIGFSGSRTNGVSVSVNAANGDWWSATLSPAQGDVMTVAPTRTPPATRSTERDRA